MGCLGCLGFAVSRSIRVVSLQIWHCWLGCLKSLEVGGTCELIS